LKSGWCSRFDRIIEWKVPAAGSELKKGCCITLDNSAQLFRYDISFCASFSKMQVFHILAQND